MVMSESDSLVVTLLPLCVWGQSAAKVDLPSLSLLQESVSVEAAINSQTGKTLQNV